MLPKNLFINLIDLDLQKCIASCNDMDHDMTEALALLLEQKPTMLKNDLEDWTVEKVDNKNILFFKGKNYIPQDDNLQWDIAKMFHDHETAGHPRELETFNSIRQHYWWLGLVFRSLVQSGFFSIFGRNHNSKTMQLQPEP